jgi:hypothetical protein
VAESEYLRTIRKTKEATERSAGYANEAVNAQLQANAEARAAAGRSEELQREAMATHESAMKDQLKAQKRAQAELLRVQIEAIDEQRAHNFAMWRQTREGEVFLAWESSATDLISRIGERDIAWKLTSQEINAQAASEMEDLNRARPADTHAALPPKEKMTRLDEPRSPGGFYEVANNLAVFSFIASLIAWPILGALMLVTGWMSGDSPSPVNAFIASYGWATPVIGVLLSLFGLIARPRAKHAAYTKAQSDYKKEVSTRAEARVADAANRDRLTKQANNNWDDSLVAARIKKYGYDPIEYPAGEVGGWTDVDSAALIGELEAFIVHSHATPPAPSSYPDLKTPPVVAISTIKSLAHRRLAVTFTD